MALTPFHIPNVPDNCLPGMFAPLHETLDRHLQFLAGRGDSVRTRLETGLFESLRRDLDAERFAAIQAEFLSREPEEDRVGHLKYLEPVFWTSDKLDTLIRHEFHRMPPRRILDIGAGPSQLLLAARHLGHAVTGTELPELIDGDSHRARFYRALCGLHDAPVLPLRLEPYKPVIGVGDSYDFITILMAIFSTDSDGVPWTLDMWRFLLTDLRDNILTSDGGLLMRLARQMVPDAVWNWMEGHTDEANHAIMEIRFNDLNWLD